MIELLSALGLVVGGLLLLVAGGDVLLRGAVGLATLLRLTPAVIGLTVVAAGTSVPELAVSGIAAVQGKPDIAVGNVVGSNIFNIAFILGLASMYRRLTLTGNTIKLEYPVMLLTTAAFVLLANDGLVGRAEGVFFLAAYVCFTAFLVRLVRKELAPKVETELSSEVRELEPTLSGTPPKLGVSAGLVAVGIALLGLGADWAVSGASTLGRLVGLSERVIGLTIVAGGTGLPELVTSLVSSYRGRYDVAIANVIGSNIFNILVIVGLTSALSPIPVSPQIVQSDNLWMLGVTILIFPIMRTSFAISRWEGALLLVLYTGYVVQLILRA